MAWDDKKGWIVALAVLVGAGGLFAWWRNSLYYGSIARVTPVDADDDAEDELVVFYDEPAPVSRTLEAYTGMTLVDQRASRVVALEMPGGSPIWNKTVRNLQFAFVHDGVQHRGGALVVSHAHPTPGLAAVDPSDGRVVWRHRLETPAVDTAQPGTWAYGRHGTVIAGKGSPDHREMWAEAFDVSSGGRRWRTEGADIGFGGAFTDERLVVGSSVVGPNGPGDIVVLEVADGEMTRFEDDWYPIAFEDRFFLLRSEGDGGQMSVHVVPDGAEEARPVTVDGEPVRFEGHPVGVRDGRFWYFSREGERGFRGLSGLPLEEGVTGVDHRFADGFAYDRRLRDRAGRHDARFSPYRRIRGRYLPVPLRRTGTGAETQRFALFDVDRGELHWRSESYRVPGDDSRWFEDSYYIGYADGDYAALVPKPWSDEGRCLVAIDAQTGRIVGAADLGEPYPEHWLHGNTVRDGVFYGATDGSPWAIDLRELEVSYGPTLAFTDVTDRFVEAAGPLPEAGKGGDEGGH